MRACAPSTSRRSPRRPGASARAGRGSMFQIIAPEHARRDPVGVRHHDRARAGRIHDLVAAHLRHAAGRHHRARQARRIRRGRGLVRGADLRVRPVWSSSPSSRAGRRDRPTPPRRSSRHDRHVHRDRHGPARRCPGPAPGPAPLLRQGPRSRRADLDIAPGELVALLGPSGCGKTTALRALGGLDEIDDGRILVDGKDITDVPGQQARTWASCSRRTACSRT